MSTTITSRLDETPEQPDSAGVARSEPVGRAKRRAGAARRSGSPELAEQVKALLPDGVLDELLSGARTEEEITGPGGLLGQLTKRLVERAMELELTDHLGYEPPPGAARRHGEHPERVDAEYADYRAGRGSDRQAAGPQRVV